MNIKKIALCAALAAAMTSPAFAADAAKDAAPEAVSAAIQPATIAIVDMQVLLQSSEAAKSIRAQLETQGKTFQVEVSKQEEELQKGGNDLKAKKDKLSEDEFTKERQAFEKKVASAQAKVQERKQALDNSFADAMDVLQTNMVGVIADVAKEKGVSIVLARQNVIIAEKNIDITDDVMKRLNAKLSKVEVKASAKK